MWTNHIEDTTNVGHGPDTAIMQLNRNNEYGAVSMEYILNLMIIKVFVAPFLCSYR